MATAAIPIGLSALSFLGGLFKHKQTQNQTSTTTPTFDPTMVPLKDRLVSATMRRLNGSGGYDAARNITNTNLQGVNQAAAGARAGLAARLAASGIHGGAAGAAMGGLENARFGQQVGVLNQEPLLGREFQNEDLHSAMGVLGLGRGSTTTGTGTMTGGGGFGGGLEDMGSMLGFLYANGGLGGGKGKTGGKPRGGIFDSGGGYLGE